jgi:hypothetical protein
MMKPTRCRRASSPGPAGGAAAGMAAAPASQGAAAGPDAAGPVWLFKAQPLAGVFVGSGGWINDSDRMNSPSCEMLKLNESDAGSRRCRTARRPR